MRTVKKALKSRALLIWLLIAIQLSIVFYISIHLTRYYYVYSYVTFVLAFVFVLYLMKASRSMSYKMAWIVVSFTFPVFGIALYLIFGGNRLTKRGRKKMEFMNAAYQDAVKDEDDATDELEAEFPDAARQVKYIRRTTMTPPVKNNETRYFRSGEEMFPVILEELRKAQKYIFLEYFIIGEGKMWDAVHEILLEKVKKGVDVRVIYDDIGCWLSLDRHFDRKLRAEGIDCRIFQRFVPVLNARQNNRDHRKILAVDGVTAFTGGINIADEYINEDSHVGYWKDNGVMMRGESAWSFTVMFLTMWDYLCGKAEDRAIRYEAYKPPRAALEGISGGGYVQPYTDSPLDGEPVGENVYLGLIANAKKYVWINTPYLIIDERMEQALIQAARCGVDVRIVTPGIPDKRLIFETTQSYYPNLLAHGVRIYEFTPGFVHAKSFVCDDDYAVVGSVNLDYRSLYLHFECGVWMYKTDCVADVKADFEETLGSCRELEPKKPGFLRMLFRSALDLIAPLL